MTPRILVIENHPDIAYNLYLTLTFNNYDVMLIKDWLKACDILHAFDILDKNWRPDLIMGDISPSMTRIQELNKIITNDSWREIPFLFLTTTHLPKDIHLQKMLKTVNIIYKPFKEEELLSSIQKILRQRKS